MNVAGLAAILCAALALNIGQSQAARQDQSKPQKAPARASQPVARSAAPARSYVDPVEQAARAKLDKRIDDMGRAFPGRVGIAVRDLQTGWTAQWQGSRYLPQQSVSKFWVALTMLDKVEQGQLSLQAPVMVRRADLTVFHQPIRTLVKGDGYETTLSELMRRALTESDNTANDFMLRRAGGPDAVRSFLRRHDIEGVRFGPGERQLQSQTAGLKWKQEYSIGNAFSRARAALPMRKRRTAFDRYLADPVDGASALGITDGLAKLKRGELLSPELTERLLDTMSRTRTGPQRLKGGLARGWTLAHKTGTGQDLAGTVAGYNDIGIITCPNGRSFAVAVMIGRTKASIPARQKLMNDVVRATIDFREALRS